MKFPLKEVLDHLPLPGSKVAVGMSGGIDSSMAVWLLKQRGCDVVGLTMSLWDDRVFLTRKEIKGCFGPTESQRIHSAQNIAQRLGVPFYVISLGDEFRTHVIDYFRSEYLLGRTPNPCTRCNRNIKFGLLLQRVREMGIHFDYFATGHYARIEYDPKKGRYLLLRGIDQEKDQSYFLALLRQDQLSRTVFPLGNVTKLQVRELARNLGFIDLLEQSESQDFLENNNYTVLFKEEEFAEGDIVDCQGRSLGRHKGIIHYTIGKRRGLGIGGAGEPYYVVGIDAQHNKVIVGRKNELLKNRMVVTDCNWIGISDAPTQPLRVLCKIRLRHEPAQAIIERTGSTGTTVTVCFENPQSAITPGQLAVFYDGDLVIGAGTIHSVVD